MQPCEVQRCTLIKPIGNSSACNNFSSILPKVLEESLFSQRVGSTIAHHCAEVSTGQCHLDLCWFQWTFRLIPRCIAWILGPPSCKQLLSKIYLFCQINHETMAMKITNAVGTRFGFRDRYVPSTTRK